MSGVGCDLQLSVLNQPRGMPQRDAAEPSGREVAACGETFQPRGSTALLDAIGRTIDATGVRLAALPEAERPDKVMVVIITDGEENASVQYTRAQIFSMITLQQDVYHWSFLFLAANQDAIAAAAAVGIGAQQSIDFAATGAGVREAAALFSARVSSFRNTATASAPGGPARKKVH